MQGVVAAGHRETAACAAEVLRAGGNAVDAAIAGVAAVFAAEPLLASCGGSGMMVVALPDREPAMIDFFSNMPGLGLAAESRPGGSACELDFEGVDVMFGSATQEFHVGRGAAAVPGALPGLARAHREFGSMPLGDIIAPAVRLAREGVTTSVEMAMVFDLLWEILLRDPEAPPAFTADGSNPRPGDQLINPALADTLAEFARLGRAPASIREGMVEFFGPDRGGLITEEDMRAYEPVTCRPLVVDLGEWQVVTSPAVGGQLVEVIVRTLTEGTPCAQERDEVVRLARASAAGHEQREGLITPGSTTHVSVVDGRGGAASATVSNGEGCGHLIPGTGVQINNFLGEEDLSPHGFHCHPVGARLPTMMAPTVLMRDGRPALALGSGGSNRIRTAVGLVLYRVLGLGQSIETAVRAPRVHAEGDTVWLEMEGLADPEGTLEALRGEFREVCPFPELAFFFGGVHTAGIDDRGAGQGVGDPRRGGAAIVL